MTERVFIILCIFARRALDMKKLEFARKAVRVDRGKMIEISTRRHVTIASRDRL